MPGLFLNVRRYIKSVVAQTQGQIYLYTGSLDTGDTCTSHSYGAEIFEYFCLKEAKKQITSRKIVMYFKVFKSNNLIKLKDPRMSVIL